MIHWDRTSLLGRVFSPLGSPAGSTLPSQAPLLEQAAPLLRIPVQHGPAHMHLIPSKALVPATIQAMVGFEMPNERLNGRTESLQALEPCGVGIPVAPLALGRDTQSCHLGRPQPLSVMPWMM